LDEFLEDFPSVSRELAVAAIQQAGDLALAQACTRMPPIMPVAMSCREAAPAPLETGSGGTAGMKAIEVIKIGRRRRTDTGIDQLS
jgi:hypothetical protein